MLTRQKRGRDLPVWPYRPAMGEEIAGPFLSAWQAGETVSWRICFLFFPTRSRWKKKSPDDFFGFDRDMAARFQKMYRPGPFVFELTKSMHHKASDGRCHKTGAPSPGAAYQKGRVSAAGGGSAGAIRPCPGICQKGGAPLKADAGAARPSPCCKGRRKESDFRKEPCQRDMLRRTSARHSFMNRSLREEAGGSRSPSGRGSRSSSEKSWPEHLRDKAKRASRNICEIGKRVGRYFEIRVKMRSSI